ncbi:hypothetical protein [Spongiactinospora sp. TRM90649]|uniref:hypothetical protein n=1 Tax=Spongiactinospora sp. TRM90649 TaxID=3031114 RepID=UPI0023F6BFCF|nr:hypothetical protein [Spongiactinospora sp. TRM90649]MDF5758014.1 hypothetical protein [Spongiactinospora sp. TRM90649]
MRSRLPAVLLLLLSVLAISPAQSPRFHEQAAHAVQIVQGVQFAQAVQGVPIAGPAGDGAALTPPAEVPPALYQDRGVPAATGWAAVLPGAWRPGAAVPPARVRAASSVAGGWRAATGPARAPPFTTS